MKAQYLRDSFRALLTLAVHHRDRHPLAQGAPLDATDADGAYVAGIIEQGHLKLQRTVRIDVGRRAVLHDGPEQGLHVPVANRGIETGEAAQRGRVYHREIQLLVGRAEAVEEIERLVEHPARTGLVPIDLVDDDDRAQAVLE